MIKYALQCADCLHGYDAWFGSSAGFDDQKSRGLVECPVCGSVDVDKQIMAPSVSGTRKDKPSSPEEFVQRVTSAARKHIAENCDYVGKEFASEARSMYYGDTEERPIWGEVTEEEKAALKDEGIPAEPLPAPFVPKLPTEPEKLN